MFECFADTCANIMMILITVACGIAAVLGAIYFAFYAYHDLGLGRFLWF